MSAKKQVEKEIREAYTFLRENNHTIPSDTLEFMLKASLNYTDLLEACNELIELLAFHGYTHSTEIYKAKQAIEKTK